MLQRVEFLESRLCLSAAGTISEADWFEVIDVREDGLADWIIQFDTDNAAPDSVESAQELLASAQSELTVIRGLGQPGLVSIQSAASDSTTQAWLDSLPQVASFERDQSVTAQLTPDDPLFGQLVGLQNPGLNGAVSNADIDADLAWDLTIGTTEIVTSVIDSGVDYRHPDLHLNIWINQGEIPVALRGQLVDVDADGLITFRDLNQPENSDLVTELSGLGFEDGNNYIDAGDLLADPNWENGIDEDGNGFTDDLIGWDFRDNDNDPLDNHGHGTHIAGTIGAIGDNSLGVAGLNWVSQIMPLRFLARVDGQGLTGSTADAISAINYTTIMATQHDVNVRVSNNSWGSLGTFSESLRTSIAENGQAGVLFVAAAGNGEGRTGRGVDLDSENIGFFPATYDLDHIVAVAATDPRDNLAQFSQFGVDSVNGGQKTWRWAGSGGRLKNGALR